MSWERPPAYKPSPANCLLPDCNCRAPFRCAGCGWNKATRDMRVEQLHGDNLKWDPATGTMYLPVQTNAGREEDAE